MPSKLLEIYSSVTSQLEVLSLHLTAHKGFITCEFVPSVFETIQRFCNRLLQQCIPQFSHMFSEKPPLSIIIVLN